MNKPNFIFKTFLFLCALCAANVFAQTDNKPPQADPCYEVVKKLKTNYSFTDYRLSTTFLQRTSSSVEYKSLLSDFTGLKDNNAPVFSDWALRNLRSLPSAAGRNAIQFESFRFGARVPILSTSRDESGKTAPVINYEAIGITTTRFSLNENEPTIVGSLATSKPDELMFLVLTVKAAE
jgi:hypothetical protein